MAQHPLILNRYRPIEEAGAGGFGTVQVAWDTRIQRKVAIKCIELDEMDVAPTFPLGGVDEPADFVSPFRGDTAFDPIPQRSVGHLPGLDEARTAAMLTDTNIVAVYDFEVQGSTAYLIMEYVEGVTLAQLLRRFDDRLTLDMVAAIFSSVAHALDVAHTNQVLHLDIKPDNVLINRQGQVKVTDFGLATLADAGGFGPAGGGTIGYMPLEQMRQESLDARCDEWALASVTYEMLTGENPFQASDLDHAESAIEEAELVLPSLCWDDLDASVDDVLFYALDPDREERYDNVVDFADELEPLLGDPRQGHRELAVVVGGAEGDDEDDGTGEIQPRRPRDPLLARLSARQLKVAAHGAGAVGSAFVALISFMNLPQFPLEDSPLLWGLLALVALAGALKPHLGALLAYLAFSVSLIGNGAYVVGGLLLAAVALWWFFTGRFGDASANVALSPPLVGAVGGGPFTPLVAGLALSPGAATATTAFSLMVAIVLAGLGSGSLIGWEPLVHMSFVGVDVQASVLAMVVRPDTWCIGASWIAAALVQSVCRLHITRLFDVLGSVLAAVILFGGAFLAAWFISSRLTWMPPVEMLASTGISAVIGIVLAARLPCVKVYEDDDPE